MANVTNRRFVLPTRRRLIQVYAALLTNAHLKGFIKGDIYTGDLKNMCVPGMNCYSCPGAVGACPLGALQNALASSDKKAPYFMFGILLLLGLIFGRTICGYLCPFGLIQDLLDKIHVPKLKKSSVTRILSYLKYVILVIFVFGIPLYYARQSLPMPGFCKYICPAGTLEGAIGLLSNPVNIPKLSMLNILFTRKFIILIVMLLGCMFIYRPFCRFICPLGAIYGLFSRVSLLGVTVDKAKCVDCGKCLAHCKMDIRHVGDHECIHCGSCIEACPTKAISYKLTKKAADLPENAQLPADSNGTGANETAKKLKKSAVIFWVLALIVLAFVFWYVNKPFGSPTPPETTTVLPPESTEASEEAPSETTETTEEASSETAETTEETSISKTEEIETGDTETENIDADSESETIDSDPSDSSDSVSDEAEPETIIETTEDDTPIGMNVGDRCPAFTAPLYGSDEVFDLKNTLGKITVINFWATWCTPCCAELPYFQQLYETYPDDVDIIALHSNLVTDDVNAYLDGRGYTFSFGLDETGAIISSLGGSTMLPMTVILDENGHICYNAVGSMTYEKLEDLVLPLLND